MPIYSEILKELRRDKGITQMQMARRFGLSRTGYASLENGKRRMTMEMLCVLADELETSTDYILERTSVQTPLPKRR